MSKLKTLKNSRGFTIVELLIVIIVIAILATLVITAYNGVQAKARDVKRQGDANSVQKAAEAYNADNSGYPTTTAQIEATTGTINLDSTIKTNLGIVAPSGSSKDLLQLQTCDTAGGNAIVYWSEQTSAIKTVYAGTHASCAAAAS